MEQNRTPKCAVVGYGSWATAIVKTLTTNRHHINWLVLNEEILQSLEHRGRNSSKTTSEKEYENTYQKKAFKQSTTSQSNFRYKENKAEIKNAKSQWEKGNQYYYGFEEKED